MFRNVIAFVLGGLLYMLLQPVLAGMGLFLLLAFIIVFLLAFFLPGGWMLLFGLRATTGVFARYLSPLFVLMLAAVFVGFITAASPTAGLAAGFFVGGLAGVYAASRFSRGSAIVYRGQPKPLYTRPAPATYINPAPGQAALTAKPPKGWSVPLVKPGGFFRGEAGIRAESFRDGVIVMGEAAIPAARALVKGAVDAGMRVVVIGSPYIAPNVGGIKLVKLGRTSFNVLASSAGLDGFARRVWAENVAIPLVVSAGLDTAEAGMVVRFIEKFAGARLTPEDADKLVAEYGPTGSARLKDALGILSTYFGESYPPPSKLFAGDWRVLVVDTSMLSQGLQLFAGIYLLYEASKLFPDCVVVFDSAELGLPEQGVLPYDARHVWLRTLKAVERLKSSGFVMVASTGLLAPELLDIADTYVVTRGPSHMRRWLSERVGVDINPSSIPAGFAYVYTRTAGGGQPCLFGGSLVDVAHADVEALEAEAEREARLLGEELLRPMRGTLLFAEFADMAEKCYKVLRAVKSLSTPTPEKVVADVGVDAERALRQLLDKQYVLVDPAGVLGLTTLGEQALRDWESKSRKQVEEVLSGKGEAHGEKTVSVQAGLQAFREGAQRAFDMTEPSRLVLRARELLMRGDALQSVGVAYKAAVRALKEVTGTAKGHLTDLAERAVEKGILKLEEDEVRRLYAANIEAKRLSKQVADGQSLSEEDLKNMRDAAELLISLTERVIAFTENLPGGEEVG